MSAQTRMAQRPDLPVDHVGDKTGLTFSIVAHLLLVVFFVFSLQWTSKPPVAFEAEIWSNMPPQQKVVTPEKIVQEEPKPEPKPEPKAEPKPEPKKEVPIEKPDIKLPKPEPKKEVKPKPEPKPEPKKEEPKKEPKKEPKPKPEPKKEEKPKPKSEPKLDPNLAKQLRAEEMARITGGAPHTASQSTGTSTDRAKYADRIRQYIRSRIVFPGAKDLSGNPEVIFEIRQLPNGEIISVTRKQSSGLEAWDSAIERAIQKSSPLPRADDGSVSTVLVVSFRPKDVQ